MTELKDDIFQSVREQLCAEFKGGDLSADRCAAYRAAFERLLSAGDFADVAIHLFPGTPNQEESLKPLLSQVRPTNLFAEERKPAGTRSPAWEKLVDAMSRRLDLERLGAVLGRKKMTPGRQALVLRRVRRNVAEYCSVVRIPTSAEESFTPFMLPRIEALIAANLRFLQTYR